MEENSYSINIKDLSSFEHICFPDSFEEYSDAVGFFLRRKNVFILEDDILEVFKDDPDVQKEMERGNQGMGAVAAFFPKRFVRETIHPKIGGEEHEGVGDGLICGATTLLRNKRNCTTYSLLISYVKLIYWNWIIS
jgi:hypothetical protein